MLRFLPLLFLFACTPAQGVYDRVTDPDNIIHDYEWFHTAFTHVQARQSQIVSTKELLTAETDKQESIRLRTELMGQQQSCRTLVADYNANAQKVTFGSFKGWSLPDALDPRDCE